MTSIQKYRWLKLDSAVGTLCQDCADQIQSGKYKSQHRCYHVGMG